MELDTRFWSLFMFIITTIMLAASVSTPYYIKGIVVTFGEQGLWKVNTANATTSAGGSLSHYTTVQVMLCVALVLAVLTAVGYLFLTRRLSIAAQLITFIGEFIAGIVIVAASIVFAVNDPKLGEAWWMATMAGSLYLLNAAVVLCLPMMDPNNPYKLMVNFGLRKPKPPARRSTLLYIHTHSPSVRSACCDAELCHHHLPPE